MSNGASRRIQCPPAKRESAGADAGHETVSGVRRQVLLNLALGVLVTVLVPRLAIARLGLDGFGNYALIVGFAGLIAFADLGLQPGLIRALAGAVHRAEGGMVRRVLVRAVVLAAAAWVALVLVCIGVLWLSEPGTAGDRVQLLLPFAAASLVTTLAELASAVLRAGGRIGYSYRLRSIYLLTYLAGVTCAYVLWEQWAGPLVICYAQMLAALPYGLLSLAGLMALPALRRVKLATAAEEALASREAWTEVWAVSLPERLGRITQMVVSACERPLLVATTGLGVVASMDLLMRISAIVSVVPAALAQPLLAMVAHDRVRADAGCRYPGAEGITRRLTAVTVLLGLAAALVVWSYFHQALFGAPSQLPAWAAVVVLVTSGVNVMTAPGAAMCLARKETKPLMRKTWIELTGVAAGIAVAIALGDGLLFVAVRYAALLVSACYLLVVDHRARQADHG